MLNKQKTSILFSSNTNNEVREEIFREAGSVICDRYEEYLGLSAVVGRSKYNALRSIKEKVWHKLQNWKNGFLSKEGKEVLIKAVLQAIPTYSMSVFQLPQRLCHEIEALFAKFWWAHQKNGKRVHWWRWDRLGQCKGRGGLGFRMLEDFNKALLAKQGWRLLKEPESLVGRIFKDKYFKNLHLLEASLGKSPSFVWRSIWSAMDVLKRGMIWRVGNGEDIKIWGQKWLPKPGSGCVQSQVSILQNEAYVNELIDTDGKRWKEELVRLVFEEEEANLILSIPIRGGAVDKVIRIATVNLEEYSLAFKKGSDGVVQRCTTRRGLGWRRHEGESFKANFDAAINEAEQTMGLGVVIRDCNGEMMAVKCANRKCRSSPFITECSAMWEAMELCKELGFWEVWLEGMQRKLLMQ
ncbi:uncharacterized protein LOC121247405 [Juglans microcarpa x Juglans regia]|uniref:uncharacterized protein LOC121247405 n=1 Tax=Juglans microcarpa x Juglans regia TaxID=2249226 RepID=UPI001B7DA371|nr:uncharacterized protein LOC121247405 [Juglans microcarpa x Juglans regia]